MYKKITIKRLDFEKRYNFIVCTYVRCDQKKMKENKKKGKKQNS